MSSPDSRARLAEAQADLLRCLVGRAGPPAGFDGARLRVAARSLVAKRAAAVARGLPMLARALGDQFSARFAEFAAVTPMPQDGGPLADACAFAQVLAATGNLSDEARLCVLALGLRFCTGPHGPVRRRGFALAAAVLRQSRRLAVGVKLPWFGEKWAVVPWPWVGRGNH